MFSFISVVLLSSMVSFSKFFLISFVLEPSMYGQYLTIYGLGIYISIIISFGLNEATLKIFPELYIKGNYIELRTRAIYIIKSYIARYFFILLILFLLGNVFNYDNKLIFLSMCIAVVNSFYSILSGFLRVNNNGRLHSKFYLYRAVLTLLVVLLFSYVWGIVGAFLSEILVLIFLFIYFYRKSEVISKTFKVKVKNKKSYPLIEFDGFIIYVSLLISSSLIYLDKLYVTTFLGTEVMLQYAPIAIFLQASILLVGTVNQRLSVRFVTLNTNNLSFIKQIHTLKNWIAIFLTLYLSLFIFVYMILKLKYFNTLVIAYDLSEIEVYLSIILAFTQVYSVFDYFFVSRGEKFKVLTSSIIFLVSFSLLSYLCYMFLEFRLLSFLVCVIAARLIQIVVQLLLIKTIHNRGPCE